jgi:hypothetical protein
MPLHLNPLERSPALFELLTEVVRPIGGTFLMPEGWFMDGHGSGISSGLPLQLRLRSWWSSLGGLGKSNLRVCTSWWYLG